MPEHTFDVEDDVNVGLVDGRPRWTEKRKPILDRFNRRYVWLTVPALLILAVSGWSIFSPSSGTSDSSSSSSFPFSLGSWGGTTSYPSVSPDRLDIVDPAEFWIRPSPTAYHNTQGAQQSCGNSISCTDWAAQGLFGTGDVLDGESDLSNPQTHYLSHTFFEGPPNRYVRGLILAWLFTQHLPNSELWVWIHNLSPENITESISGPDWAPLLARTGSKVLFKRFEPDELKTPETPHLDVSQIDPIVLSDMARVLILNRFGGLYLDADSIPMRDLRPLLNLRKPWAYSWTCWPWANTAVFSIQKDDGLALDLLHGAVERNYNFHPRTLSEIAGERLTVYSSELFDPIWRWFDKCREWPADWPPERGVERSFNYLTQPAIGKKEHRTCFRGIYTWHHHLSYQAPVDNIPPTSWFIALEKEWMRFVFEGGKNAYGEVYEIPA